MPADDSPSGRSECDRHLAISGPLIGDEDRAWWSKCRVTQAPSTRDSNASAASGDAVTPTTPIRYARHSRAGAVAATTAVSAFSEATTTTATTTTAAVSEEDGVDESKGATSYDRSGPATTTAATAATIEGAITTEFAR